MKKRNRLEHVLAIRKKLKRNDDESDFPAQQTTSTSRPTTEPDSHHSLVVQSVQPVSPTNPVILPSVLSSATRSPPHQSRSDAATPSATLPALLWMEAYDLVNKDDPKLVEEYQKILRRELSGPGSTLADNGDVDGQTGVEQPHIEMVRLVEASLKKIAKEGSVRHKVEGTVRVASSLKNLLGAALKSAPEAAMVWGGVCLLVQILERSAGEPADRRDGMAYAVSRIDWYWNLSSLLLDVNHEKTTGLRDELEKHIIDLYKEFISYQMKSVCFCNRKRFGAFIRDALQLDDWPGAVKCLKDAENAVQQDMDTFSTQDTRITFNNIAKQAESQCSRLQEIHVEIKKNAEKQAERHQDDKNNECIRDLFLTDPRDDKVRIENTKGGLFRGASSWILDHDDFIRWRDGDARLLWIKGDPGKGKTMLMITLVNELERQLLHQIQDAESGTTQTSTTLSYFFCQGTSNNLNNATAVLRGLMYLLAVQNPALISHFRTRYDTAGSNLLNHANTFFALSKVLESMLCDERLAGAYLAVDALDECMEDREQLLQLIVNHTATFPNIKWIVSSRNRADIEQYLKIQETGMKLSLEITQNAEQVSQAVDAYIDFKVAELQLLPENEQERLQARDSMRGKANGTFLWVALVIRELRTTDDWDVLDVLEEMPTELEQLYDRMMGQIQRLKRQNPEFCRRVLGTVATAYSPLRVAELGILSEIPDRISSNTNMIRKLITLCGSFLTIRDDFVYVVHQSVKDYLSGTGSKTIFPKGRGEVHHAISLRSLHALSTGVLRRNMYKLPYATQSIDIKTPKPDPLGNVRYSCVHWATHFCDMAGGNMTGEDAKEIDRFIRTYFLYWLEALALLKSLSDGIISIQRLNSLVEQQNSTSELTLLLVDSVRFSLYHYSSIEATPLQAYTSALLFSPSESIIRRIFQNEVPQWITIKPIVQAEWSSCIQTLDGHRGEIMSIAFSVDGKLIAPSAQDGPVKIWEVTTGKCLQTLDGSDDRFIFLVVFSVRGLIATVGCSPTIKLWEPTTGRCLKAFRGYISFYPDNDHELFSYSIAFSGNGERIAFASFEAIEIFEVETGKCLQMLEREGPDFGHCETPPCIAFSVRGLLAARLTNGTIKIWDVGNSANSIAKYLKTLQGHDKEISGLSFSPDGNFFASVSVKGNIEIWDGALDKCLRTLDSGRYEMTLSVSVSHNGLITSTSHDGDIDIWDIVTGERLKTVSPSIQTELSPSPTGNMVASTPLNSIGVIKLWNPRPGKDVKTQEEEDDVTDKIIPASKNGDYFASSSYQAGIRIWEAQTGKCAKTFKYDRAGGFMAGFSPLGTFIVLRARHTGINRDTIWEVATGNCVEIGASTNENDMPCGKVVTWSADEKLVAYRSRSVISIWEMDTGRGLQTFDLTEPMIKLAFLSDARFIAFEAGTFWIGEETVQIWEIATGRLLKTIAHGDFPIDSPSGSWGYLLPNTGCIIPPITSLGDWHRNYPPSCPSDDQGILRCHAPTIPYAYRKKDPACPLDFSIGKDWMMWNGQKLLWIPYDYRPSGHRDIWAIIFSPDKPTTVSVAMVSGLSMFHIIGFSGLDPFTEPW